MAASDSARSSTRLRGPPTHRRVPLRCADLAGTPSRPPDRSSRWRRAQLPKSAIALRTARPLAGAAGDGAARARSRWSFDRLGSARAAARASQRGRSRGGGWRLVVVGGFIADGNNSAHVDAYSVGDDRWRRLPDLPVAVDHAAAASANGRVYVAGGYGAERVPLRTVFVLADGAWRRLPPLPDGRAAAAAAVARGRLYVVGGRDERRALARVAFVLELGSSHWKTIPGPSPREHLAAATSLGRVYAVGGRAAGIDTNERAFQVYDASARRWQRLAPLPGARGGTGAAALGGRIVSVGGEQPAGTIRTVFSYDVRKQRWSTPARSADAAPRARRRRGERPHLGARRRPAARAHGERDGRVAGRPEGAAQGGGSAVRPRYDGVAPPVASVWRLVRVVVASQGFSAVPGWGRKTGKSLAGDCRRSGGRGARGSRCGRDRPPRASRRPDRARPAARTAARGRGRPRGRRRA